MKINDKLACNIRKGNYTMDKNYIKTKQHEAVYLRSSNLITLIQYLANHTEDFDKSSGLLELVSDIMNSINLNSNCLVLKTILLEPGDDLEAIIPTAELSYLKTIKSIKEDTKFYKWTESLNCASISNTESTVTVSADLIYEILDAIRNEFIAHK